MHDQSSLRVLALVKSIEGQSKATIMAVLDNKSNLEKIVLSNGKFQRHVYKIPVGGAADLETVLQCIEYFCQTGGELGFAAADYFTQFERILEDRDLEHFLKAKRQTSTLSMEDFVDCMKRFVVHYCSREEMMAANNNQGTRKINNTNVYDQRYASWGPQWTWWGSNAYENKELQEGLLTDRKELRGLLSCDLDLDEDDAEWSGGELL